MTAPATADLLVVGAGPTGLTLALQATLAGARVVVVERRREPRPESRAFALHARSLEVLQPLGAAAGLVDRGLTTADLVVHAGRRSFTGRLAGGERAGTRFGFLLFLPQADTEAVLVERLAAARADVRWGTELVGFEQDAHGVTARVRLPDDGSGQVPARFLAGCDGAASTVRAQAGIAFPGRPYRHSVLLADAEVGGDLRADALHAFLGVRGMLFCFPYGQPGFWRVLTMVRRSPERAAGRAVGLEELQAAADRVTGGAVRLRALERSSEILLDHRQARRYRRGRVFLAGDAAHVHSPAGAQGMNLGIQDAGNLGWKLAAVARGAARSSLLDTYEVERRPAARRVRHATDLAFLVEGSEHALIGLGRTVLAPLVAPVLLRSPVAMRAAIRAVSGLPLRYPRSPLTDGGRAWRIPRIPAGARLPDLEVSSPRGTSRLHDLLAPASLHLLLCGPSWGERGASLLRDRHAGSLQVHRLSPRPAAGALHDPAGTALRRLGVRGDAHLLVRPDGYVAFRRRGTDLDDLERYLTRWLTSTGQV